MEIKTKKSDIILNIFAIFFSLLGNFIMLPFMMRILSKEVLALWYVFQSIGAIVSLLDFGFSPTISRNVVYACSGAESIKKIGVENSSQSKVNFVLLKKIISTCKLLYLIISTVGIIAIAIAGSFYIISIAEEVALNDYIYAWIVYLAAVFFNMYFGYYSVFLRGIGAINKNSIATIVSRIIQISTSIAMLYLGFGLLSVSIGYFLNGFIYRILAKYFFYKQNNFKEELKNVKEKITFKEDVWGTFKIMWPNAWKDGVVSLASYLSSYFITIICSYFLTLADTSIYSISSQFILGISAVSAAVFASFQPSIQSSVSYNRREETVASFSLSMFAYAFIHIVGVTLFIFVGVPLIKYVRSDYVFNTLMLVLLGVSELVIKWQSLHCSLISCYNRIPYVWAHLITSVVSIGIIIVLLNVTELGMYALVVGPIVANLLFNAWYWPLYAIRLMKTNPIEMAKGGFHRFTEMIKPKKHENS